jgi:hypothetical protein
MNFDVPSHKDTIVITCNVSPLAVRLSISTNKFKRRIRASFHDTQA